MNLKKAIFAFALTAFVGFAAIAQEKASPAKKAEGTPVFLAGTPKLDQLEKTDQVPLLVIGDDDFIDRFV